MNSNLKAFALRSVITAAAIVAALLIIVNAARQPIVEDFGFNDTWVVLHPSVAKAASLALGFWGVLGLTVGSLIAGASMWAQKYGIGFKESSKEGLTLALTALAGIAIMASSYLAPAYRVQTYTTKTVTKTELQSIKKIDREFTKKFQADPNILKSKARPNEL